MPLTQEQPVVRFLRRLRVREHVAQLSDRVLLERFINTQEQEAFAALVSRHGPLVYRVCRQVLQNLHDAEDAFQATFLVLSRKARSVRRRESISSWLFGVAHHCATNLRRSQNRRRHHEHQACQSAAPDLLSTLVARETQAILYEELARLPEKYRAPLLLCSLQGLSRDEAAQQLGLGPGTLKTYLEQGRNRLRLRLVARGLTASAALVAPVLGEQTASAAIPAGLEALTVEAACQAVTGSAIAPVGAQVAALAQGVLKAMLISKINFAAGIVLVVGMIAAGSGFMIAGSFAAQNPPAQPEATPAQPVKKTQNATKTRTRTAPLVRFRFGEQVRPHFFLKNTGKKPLRVSYPVLIGPGWYKALKFTDSRGRAIAVPKDNEPPEVVTLFGGKLGPGEQAEVYGIPMGIGYWEEDTEVTGMVLAAKPGHEYAIEYTLPDYDDRKLADMQTGKFRFAVLARGKPQPKPLTKEEIKKAIAWGKPDKNGLQIGLVLLPVSQPKPADPLKK
jgi:RNA polymerase sigma factor (sigma-70 family)